MGTNGRNFIGALTDDAILDLAKQLQDAKIMISKSQRTLAQSLSRLCSRLEKMTAPSRNPDISHRYFDIKLNHLHHL